MKAVWIGLAIALLLWLLPIPSGAIAPAPSLPTTPIEWNGQYAQVPDWSQITFRTLPPIQSSGSFNSSADINQALGYDLSRRWQAGQTADQYLKLGDFQTSLYPQIFNLYTIAQTTHFDLNQVALSALEMAKWQTVNDLVTAIPGLGNYPVGTVLPIAALLKQPIQQIDSGTTIAELLNTNPDFGDMNLGQLGKQLEAFAISDIPGLSGAENFLASQSSLNLRKQ